MNRWLVFCLVGLVMLSACHRGGQADKSIPLLSGKSLSVKPMDRAWLLVNYWAPWCDPCRQEIQALNQFARIHANVYLLGVNFDGGNSEALSRAVKTFDIHYAHAQSDPSAVLGIKEIPALPVTFVFNRSGRLTKTLYGPQTVASLDQAIGDKALR